MKKVLVTLLIATFAVTAFSFAKPTKMNKKMEGKECCASMNAKEMKKCKENMKECAKVTGNANAMEKGKGHKKGLWKKMFGKDKEENEPTADVKEDKQESKE